MEKNSIVIYVMLLLQFPVLMQIDKIGQTTKKIIFSSTRIVNQNGILFSIKFINVPQALSKTYY